MKKKITAVILVLCLTLGVVQAFAASSTTTKTINVAYGIKVMVNGQTLIPKDVEGNIVDPFVLNGTTYVPIRAISEALGAEAGFDEATNTAGILGKEYQVQPNVTADQYKEAMRALNLYRNLKEITYWGQENVDWLQSIYNAIHSGVSQSIIDNALSSYSSEYIAPIREQLDYQKSMLQKYKNEFKYWQTMLERADSIITNYEIYIRGMEGLLTLANNYNYTKSAADYKNCEDLYDTIWSCYLESKKDCDIAYDLIYTTISA